MYISNIWISRILCLFLIFLTFLIFLIFLLFWIFQICLILISFSLNNFLILWQIIFVNHWWFKIIIFILHISLLLIFGIMFWNSWFLMYLMKKMIILSYMILWFFKIRSIYIFLIMQIVWLWIMHLISRKNMVLMK